MRILQILSLIFFLLFGALFATRCSLLEQVALSVLNRAGAETIRLHIADIGLHQAHLTELTATFRTSDATAIPVRLQGLTLHYSLPELLKTGQCHQLVIRKMTLGLDAGAKAPDTPVQLPENFSLLNRDLRARIPIKELDIEQLHLTGTRFTRFNSIPFRVKAAVRGPEISATVTVQPGHASLLSIELHSPDPDHATLNILGRQQDQTLIRANLRLQPEQLTGTVSLQAGPLRDMLLQIMDSDQLPEMSFDLKGNFSISLLDFPNNTFSLNLQAVNLNFQDLHASSALLQATGKFEHNSLLLTQKSRLELSSLALKGATVHKLALDLAGTFTRTPAGFNTVLNFSPLGIDGNIRGTVSCNLSVAAGSFKLQTDHPLDLNRKDVTLSNLFTPWKLPFDLNRGILTAQAKGHWAPGEKTQLAVSFHLKQGAGFYKHFLFNGLESSQDLVILPRVHSKTPGKISLEHLTGGIDLDTITTSIELKPSVHGSLPQIHLSNFNASLFDGTLNSPDIIYDLNRAESNFTININKINMEPLVGLLQQNDLQVSGRLSGTLPIQIINKKISVKNGELHNEPPGGEIRYTPGNLDQQGITGYALKAVQDFRYDSLQTTAMYAPSGELDLDIHLQGISPLLDKKRPVHLNIHAEQNLPDLLKSLRFSKGLIEKLDKRIQRQYK
jgi:hypothetical protein